MAAQLAAFITLAVLAALSLSGCATVAKHPPMICGVVAPGVLYCEEYGEQATPALQPAPQRNPDKEA
jgi:uncharacterized protein YceK